MSRRIAGLTDVLLLALFVVTTLGYTQAQSVEVLSERIQAAQTLYEIQDARIVRIEAALLRNDERQFYMLLATTGNLFGIVVMLGLKFFDRKKL